MVTCPNPGLSEATEVSRGRAGSTGFTLPADSRAIPEAHPTPQAGAEMAACGVRRSERSYDEPVHHSPRTVNHDHSASLGCDPRPPSSAFHLHRPSRPKQRVLAAAA
jgi:hypothetical protein